MKRIFISYAREDRATARKLYWDLRIRGLEPWIDTEDLLPGEDWKQAIEAALQQSRFVIVLLSRHSTTKKGYVQKEIRDALSLLDLLPHNAIFIIPVRVEPCSVSHPRLASLHWVDLFPSYETALAKILKSVGRSENPAVFNLGADDRPSEERETLSVRDLAAVFTAVADFNKQEAARNAIVELFEAESDRVEEDPPEPPRPSFARMRRELANIGRKFKLPTGELVEGLIGFEALTTYYQSVMVITSAMFRDLNVSDVEGDEQLEPAVLEARLLKSLKQGGGEKGRQLEWLFGVLARFMAVHVANVRRDSEATVPNPVEELRSAMFLETDLDLDFLGHAVKRLGIGLDQLQDLEARWMSAGRPKGYLALLRTVIAARRNVDDSQDGLEGETA